MYSLVPYDSHNKQLLFNFLKILLEKLTVAKLAKKVPPFMEPGGLHVAINKKNPCPY
jgi:hypothetical protein